MKAPPCRLISKIVSPVPSYLIVLNRNTASMQPTTTSMHAAPLWNHFRADDLWDRQEPQGTQHLFENHSPGPCTTFKKRSCLDPGWTLHACWNQTRELESCFLGRSCGRTLLSYGRILKRIIEREVEHKAESLPMQQIIG